MQYFYFCHFIVHWTELNYCEIENDIKEDGGGKERKSAKKVRRIIKSAIKPIYNEKKKIGISGNIFV